MGDLRETSQQFARIHTGIQMLYSLFLEWFEAGSSSLESSQVGIHPSLSAVHNIPKSLVSGGCHHNGVFVALPVTGPNEKTSLHRHGSLVKSLQFHRWDRSVQHPFYHHRNP